MRPWFHWATLTGLGLSAVGCREANVAESRGASVPSPVAAKLAQYTPVRLTADLSGLSEGERRMLPLLIDAAREMDGIFWQQVDRPARFGSRRSPIRHATVRPR